MNLINNIYKKENFIIIPVCNNFIIINIEKKFKEGYTYIKNINTGKLIIDLIIKRKLPRNYMLVNNILRLIHDDKEYKSKLIQFKEYKTLDFSKLMQEGHVYRKNRGSFKQIR